MSIFFLILSIIIIQAIHKLSCNSLKYTSPAPFHADISLKIIRTVELPKPLQPPGEAKTLTNNLISPGPKIEKYFISIDKNKRDIQLLIINTLLGRLEGLKESTGSLWFEE
jgi:hypothetical protein